MPIPIMEPANVPLTKAWETAVQLPVGRMACTDGFIDDLITVALDIMNRNNS
jgi:hypothetical protein